MSKHTQGPWTVQADQSDHGRSTAICGAGNDDLLIARIPSRAWNPLAPLEYPQDRANAHLVAAAPDLLEALRAVMACPQAAPWLAKLPTHDGSTSVYEQAIAAIRKAEGAT